jgi:two-component system sensor histidine kinase PhcS
MLHSLPIEQRQAFEQSEQQLRYARTLVGLALGVAMMPGGALLDWFEYPGEIRQLTIVRLATTLVMAAGLLVVWRIDVGRQIDRVSWLLLALPAIAIATMIALTNGSESPYFIGLMLLLTVAQLLGFDAYEAGAFSLLCVSSYLAAVAYRGSPWFSQSSLFIQGIFFLCTTAAVAIATCFITYQNRLADFLLRRELDAKNAALRQEEERLRESLVQLRKTQQLLQQSEKLRTIGNLAAGLLHEINNPVNIAQMAVQLLPRRLEQGKDVTPIVADIGESLDRIGHIVGDLRSFAYPEQQHLSAPFELADAVSSALRFTTRECDGISVTNEVPVHEVVEGSKTQVTQVLLNLLTNAATAIRKASRPGKIRVRSWQEAGRAYVQVTDNGVGIEPERLPHVSDIFHTSADAGEGMGLGLSICDGIVRSHGGQLRITSQLGVGTEVVFDLPLAQVEGTPDANDRYATADSLRRR